MVTAVYYPSRQPLAAPLGAPPPTVAPQSFGMAAANFVAMHSTRRSINVNGHPFHATCPPANMGSGRVPVAGGYGQMAAHQPIPSGMIATGSWNQVRGQCDALSRSTPSNGLTPLTQLRSVPACKTPQSPHKSSVQESSGEPKTPKTPIQKSTRDQLSASQRPYTSRALPPQTGLRPQGSPSAACSGGRAVSPRVMHSGHFVWPRSVQAPSGSPLTPTRAKNLDLSRSVQAPSGSPLTPTRAKNLDLLERHAHVAPPAKTVVKVQTCENAPPVQAKGRAPVEGTPKQGKAVQSPFPRREVLRERNEQSTPPAVGRSPFVPLAERSPVGNVLSSELPSRSPVGNVLSSELPSRSPVGNVLSSELPSRSPVGNVLSSELPSESSAKHAWQDVYLAANASPPAVASASPPAVVVSTSVGPKQPTALPEELQIVPRDLAPEVSDVTPSLGFSLTNAHPMVTPEEKVFILSSLEAFSEVVEREGGFKQYTLKDSCETREELIGAWQDDEQSLTPQELLRRSIEAALRNTVRTGHESVTVLLGAPYSMGMKKVVKAEVKCEDTGLYQVMSIYWDWDVKLEQRSGLN